MADTQKNRRPVRAFFYGLIWGLGVFLWLTVAQPLIGLDDLTSVIAKGAAIIGGAIVLSLLWAYLGPTRKPKGEAPVATSARMPEAETAAPSGRHESAPGDTDPGHNT